ncbi:MAG: GNAT family N-acetyltransferase [Caldilinea sp.]|nr:GNAT family N-acetyltransferase [Caldilineaceae bacterium]MCO5208849.1 GNAT family N-acetyltransferase [Caldilinea sp.]MCW5840294.1 GNAT family N-acetyltransferase [Caldilinea sp.]
MPIHNQDSLRALYTSEERIGADYPDVRREVLPHLIRQVPKEAGGEGFIAYTALDASNADDVIREQIAFFEQIGADFEWKLYDYDTPPDLKARLAAHGFEIGEPESLMILPLDAAPPALLVPVTHDVRRLADPAELEYIRAIKDAMEPGAHESLLSYLRLMMTQNPERMSFYVALVEEQPVSCAWIHFPPDGQFASLWGGSTLPAFRGRGLYTALLAARVQEAIRRGRRYLTIDAGPMSRPIVERFGFIYVATTHPCIWTHGSADS